MKGEEKEDFLGRACCGPDAHHKVSLPETSVGSRPPATGPEAIWSQCDRGKSGEGQGLFSDDRASTAEPGMEPSCPLSPGSQSILVSGPCQEFASLQHPFHPSILLFPSLGYCGVPSALEHHLLQKAIPEPPGRVMPSQALHGLSASH